MTTIRFIQYMIVTNALLLIFQTIRVIAIYSAIYSLTSDRVKRQLPLHVWLIATSYLIYALGTTYILYVAPDFNVYLRTTLFGVAGTLGQYAIWNVLSYERRRYTEATNFADSD